MDREKVVVEIEDALSGDLAKAGHVYKLSLNGLKDKALTDALAVLKEQQSLLGIQQTADGITFLSTGTAQVGEKRGILLGKLFMHDWLEKKLLYSGLLTDEIRAVFDEAKQI